MRFKWRDDNFTDEWLDYDLHVTVGNVEGEFVGYVRQVPEGWVVRSRFNDDFEIPSEEMVFPTALQAMRVLRKEVQIAIIGGVEP